MKILFLSDNFPPEYNAPATRTFEHCKEWVKLGAEVTVITCFPNFPQGKIFEGYKNKFRDEEFIEGIRVIRVWSLISRNEGFIKRTMDFISYASMAFFAGLFIKTDIIIATSPQFFTAVSGYFLSVCKRKKWIMEVRDLWPETISAVNAIKTNVIINCLEKLELFLYKKATNIIVVTDAFKRNMIGRSINENKIFVVKNGVNFANFSPRSKNSKIEKKLGLTGCFVIGYIGTHGLTHNLSFVVESASKIQNLDIKFLFIGEGAEKTKIIKTAENLHVQNIIFHPPVKKEEIADYISVIDIALVPLRKSNTFKSVIPSKIFESAAMGKPILLGVDGESREIIETYGAGLFFEPQNENDFINKIITMKELADSNKNIFEKGSYQLAADFDRKKLAKEMLQIIKNCLLN